MHKPARDRLQLVELSLLKPAACISPDDLLDGVNSRRVSGKCSWLARLLVGEVVECESVSLVWPIPWVC